MDPYFFPIAPGEREYYKSYDYERSVQLSQMVGRIFGSVLGIGLILLAIYFVFHPQVASAPYRWMGLILLKCLVFYAIGIWLAKKRLAMLAACFVVGSTILAILTVQVTWEIRHGVDSFTIALFFAYGNTIGLASVLGNPRRMLLIVTLINMAIVLFVCLLLPHWIAPTYPLVTALITALAIIVVEAVMAYLLNGASRLYEAAMLELDYSRIALQRAKKLDAIKDQFITSVNHELRNPIMALNGYIEVLHQRGEAMSPAKRSTLLGQAVEVGERLVESLEGILTARRLDQESQDFPSAPISLRATLDAALMLIDPRESETVARDLIIQIPDHFMIWGEAVRLQQIMVNLLSNAIKYSTPGTPLEVSASVVTEMAVGKKRRWRRTPPVLETWAEIRVRDHGIGIPPEQIPLLFQRFVRLPRDATSSISGNGLGLYLCRLLTAAMHGKIWVESQGIAGEGSTFILRLPIPPATATLELPVSAPEALPQLVTRDAEESRRL